MSSRPKQIDVAKLANVSRTTVSYVLSNRLNPRIPITEETRQKVLQAAQELGYHPNALASGLRSGLSYTIGLLIPDMHNPFYLEILDGVEKEVTDRGYYLTSVSTNLEPEREHRCLQSLFQGRLDGLIIVPTFAEFLEEAKKSVSELTRPAVFVARIEGVDKVVPNTRRGAVLMMEHLTALGHRRIGFINGVGRRSIGQRRLEVYRETLSAVGAPVDEQLIRYCGHTVQDGYLAAQELLALPQPPTAIWAINDLLALGILRLVHERGLRVPADISVAGFDDISLAAQFYPPLTTIRMFGETMGRRAAQMLFQRIQNPETELMQEILEPELIIRQSTGPVNISGDS